MAAIVLTTRRLRHSPFSTEVGTDPERQVVELSKNPAGQLYQSDFYKLAFLYPDSWILEDRPFLENRSTEGRVLHQIFLQGDAGDNVTISIFARSGTSDLYSWASDTRGWTSPEEAEADLLSARATIDGREAYLWRTAETGLSGVLLAFESDRHLYVVGFPIPSADPDAVEAIIKSLATGGNGYTELPIDLSEFSGYPVPVVACCSESDPSTNTYECCGTTGNCTWKAERDRTGADNFKFGGSGTGRDAYKWMTLARQYTSYSQGGTIPAIGAVLVAIDDYGVLGHVGTVKAINTNGSVVLKEQNCGATCSRDKTYTTSWLLQYIAGYIYTGSSAPTPTGKSISSTGETIVEDYNFSNVYNFGAYGPGSKFSFNNNERAWGTLSAGRGGCMHYVLSRTGTSENYGRWRATTQASGLYEIQAWIPNSTSAAATSIKYEVAGVLSSAINQSTNRNSWVKIKNPGRADGYWNLGVATYSIYLRDNANSTANQRIAFDAIKFIKRGSS